MSPKFFLVVCLAGISLNMGLGVLEAAQIDQATRYLEHSASLSGPTGWINVPSASVAESGEMTAAIHRGAAKINLGLLGVAEGGIYFEADLLGDRFEPYRDLSSVEKITEHVPPFFREAFQGHGKIKLLDQDWAGLSLAAGLEERDTYVVAQHYWRGLSKLTLLVGWGTGRFAKGFGGFGKTLFPGADLIFEFDGAGINIGLRMLLAPNLVLEFAGQNLGTVGEVQNLGEVISEHLLFGVSYVERVW